MKKQFFITGLTAGIILTALSACSSGQEQEAISDEAFFNADTQAVAPESPVTEEDIFDTTDSQPFAPAIPVEERAVVPVAPSYDCTNLPTSKAGLTIYRENCI